MPKIKQFNKEKVLEAASNIFRQKGYNGTSIDEILVVTGLSRSSLYDSFNDKHNLYLLALEHYKNTRQDQYEKLDKKPFNGLQKIEILFKEVVNYLVNNPNDNGCLMVNAAAEMSKQCTKTKQVICNEKEDVQNLLNTWLADALDKKLVSLSKPIKTYSQFLYNNLVGLRVLSQGNANKAELLNVVKISLDSLN